MPGSSAITSYSHMPPPSRASHSVPPLLSQPEIQWSAITPSLASVEKLRLLCHSQKELKKEGYVLKPLDVAQIEAKLRCIKCGKRASRKPVPKPVVLVTTANTDQEKPVGLAAATTVNQDNQQQQRGTSKFCDVAVGGCGKSGHTMDTCWRLHPELKHRKRGGKVEKGRSIKLELDSNNTNNTAGRAERQSGDTTNTSERADRPSVDGDATLGAVAGAKTRRSKTCQYHVGRVRDKHFTCCNRHVSQPGCIEDEEHDLPAPNDPTTLQDWQFHTTPPAGASQSGKGPTRYCQAIALDCEMGTSRAGESELIRLTAVDFFTRAVLIDNLVCPAVPMAHYNTRYSGVTAGNMRSAIRARTAIHGRDAALRGLLGHVGPQTVVVVHGGSSDLRALRWIHPHVVDTYILEGYASATSGGKSLQNLCRVKLGIHVQARDRPRGKLGHDSLEDALATRELAISWVESIPG
ncbi:hypothetical protein A1O7_05664 [Cladophialophora yegresii CBS 114405]|uniref:Exonuclease domain-containing protein n=1 Tax=Cladophialophora yegresii CBS 114405 TaxID=1182544 RepID=W9WIA5_9EURO|nr:uncharacterized protein A1O7_05664 [Cladophialophora yegresii CBS 114405]EXJ58239.1 hypothetical protein A1O7_05664 [Cladophialophora yegresii CBS 114405]